MTQFTEALQDIMVALGTKSSELQQFGPVGADLETVQSQMEEYRVRGLWHHPPPLPPSHTHTHTLPSHAGFSPTQGFELAVQALVPTVEDVRSKGKALQGSCAVSDRPHISDQLDKMNELWHKVNSEGMDRKHSLESALLQLGQFHDAVAEFLHWVNNATAGLNAQKQPGVTMETTEAHLKVLEVWTL